MKRRWVIVVTLLAGAAFGQSLSPPIAEYREKVNGVFEVSNHSEISLVAIVDTRSFSVNAAGEVEYRPLDPGLTVDMGTNSFVLRPHDSRYVFYKAVVPSAPASLAIVVTMTKAGEVGKGLRINYIFPHMVYVYQKERLKRTDVAVSLNRDTLRIQNLSDKLGRVEEIKNGSRSYSGFPLYPRQTRDIRVDGIAFRVQFEDGFHIDVNR